MVIGLGNGVCDQRTLNLKEETYLSNEKRAPGWLGYIGDDTTQLYRDYNKPL